MIVDIGPLEAATKRMQASRAEGGRPFDLDAMNVDQLNDEKRAIKKELRAYDKYFEDKYGRAPQKEDKEPLRPLYQRYAEVKKRLESGSSTVPTKTAPTTSAAVGGASSVATAPNPSQNLPLSVSQSWQPPAGNIPLVGSIGTPEEYQRVKVEKKALQAKLHEYQTAFERLHGRKITFRVDRLPMEQEYERYKHLKSLLEEYEKKGK